MRKYRYATSSVGLNILDAPSPKGEFSRTRSFFLRPVHVLRFLLVILLAGKIGFRRPPGKGYFLSTNSRSRIEREQDNGAGIYLQEYA
jgi:hypothetical protein